MVACRVGGGGGGVVAEGPLKWQQLSLVESRAMRPDQGSDLDVPCYSGQACVYCLSERDQKTCMIEASRQSLITLFGIECRATKFIPMKVLIYLLTSNVG